MFCLSYATIIQPRLSNSPVRTQEKSKLLGQFRAGSEVVMNQAQHHEKEDPIWGVVAALLLTSSVIMLTDFSHRLLGSDPDGFGILSVTVQALFTVVATSTFTKTGWSRMQNLFSRFKLHPQSRIFKLHPEKMKLKGATCFPQRRA